MIATHFPPQRLAQPGAHYHLHGREVASRDFPLGTVLDVEFRHVSRRHHERRVRRYVLRGLHVADVCGIPGRLDFETGTFRDFITSRGGDDGRAAIRVIAVHRRPARRHHRSGVHHHRSHS